MKLTSVVLFFALTVSAGAQELFQWSDWIPTSESATEYRYELTGDSLLSLQFRNDGKAPSQFDYEIVIPGQDEIQHGNASLKAHRTSTEINVATNHARPPSKVRVNSCVGTACRY